MFVKINCFFYNCMLSKSFKASSDFFCVSEDAALSVVGSFVLVWVGIGFGPLVCLILSSNCTKALSISTVLFLFFILICEKISGKYDGGNNKT